MSCGFVSSPSLFVPGSGAEPRLCSAVTTNFSGLNPWERARLKKTQQRRDLCGKQALRIQHRCGAIYWMKKTCRTRICSECGTRLNNEKARKFKPLSRLHVNESEGGLRLITFTFDDARIRCKTPTDWRDWIRARTQLVREFLMGRDTPKKWNVRGYIAVWEITSRADGSMHPHLHVVAWSGFMPRAQVVKLWHERTGAWNVDIRPAEAGALGYVLKYVAKPWPGISEEIQAIAFHRTRRITATGEFYNQKLHANLERVVWQQERYITRACCLSCGIPQPSREDAMPIGRAWKPPPGEWRTVDTKGEVSPDAEALPMMRVSWRGRDLWPDVQRCALPQAPQAEQNL